MSLALSIFFLGDLLFGTIFPLGRSSIRSLWSNVSSRKVIHSGDSSITGRVQAQHEKLEALHEKFEAQDLVRQVARNSAHQGQA